MAARAADPTGPYERAPGNPILTHRCEVLNPIQATGHGDLIEDAFGQWWLLFLGIRQVRGSWHHLGRETFLAPVSWDEKGWPIVNGGEPVRLIQEIELPDSHPGFEQQSLPQVIEYDCMKPLGPEWNTRGNVEKSGSGWEQEDGRVLTVTPGGLRKTTGCSFVGLRQRDFSCSFQLSFSWEPGHAEDAAGLAVIMNEEHFYALEARGDRLSLLVRLGSLELFGSAAGFEELPANPEGVYRFEVAATRERYTFSVVDQQGTREQIGSLECRFLSTEVAGGFTGVYLGPYSHSDVHSSVMHVHSCRYERFLEEH